MQSVAIESGRGPVAVEAAAARGTVLDGVLFRDAEEAAPDAVVLAVTGIHGNFHSFSQVARIGTPGALLIGSFDVFAGGETVGFLRNIAAHFPEPGHNRLVVIPGTGHTYRGKERETARAVAELVARWWRE